MPNTVYPAAIDTFTDPGPSTDEAVVSHAQQHAHANDALLAIENELGINPSGSVADITTRLAAIEVANATAFALSMAFHGA